MLCDSGGFKRPIGDRRPRRACLTASRANGGGFQGREGQPDRLGGERPMNWTDERVELLKKLWADGLSASQIAAELGGITRNAVIGKVHRLGLSGRAQAPSSSVPR